MDQYRVHVEQYVKASPNQWLLTKYASPEVVLSFESFDCQVAIADLYEGIELTIALWFLIWRWRLRCLFCWIVGVTSDAV